MSLEKALEANTAAVLLLTQALNANRAATPNAESQPEAKSESQPEAKFEPQPEAKSEPQPTLKKSEPAAKLSKGTAAPAAATPAFIKAEPVAATSTSLSYDDIKAPFLDLAKRDLPVAQALIAEFGFKTLKDAKPEQYAEILEKLSANSEEGMA